VQEHTEIEKCRIALFVAKVVIETVKNFVSSDPVGNPVVPNPGVPRHTRVPFTVRRVAAR